MNVTLPTGLEVSTVDKDDFRNEKLYQATMGIARKMFFEGLISEEEYRQIDTIFLAKYHANLIPSCFRHIILRFVVDFIAF